MKSNSLNPLFSIAGITLIALAVAAVLFGLLQSSGIFKYGPLEFGGAAAGFFGAFWLLRRWYDNINKSIFDKHDLAVLFARIVAGGMVKEVERNLNDLSTEYIATLTFLRSQLRNQEARILSIVEEEFREEVVCLSQVITEFKGWSPPPEETPLAV
jgi:hypothetical protein